MLLMNKNNFLMIITTQNRHLMTILRDMQTAVKK